MTLLRKAWPWFGQDFWLNTFVRSSIVPVKLRSHLASLNGLVSARGARIDCGVMWWGSGPVSIAPGAFLNRGVYLNHSAPVVVERGVEIGPRVSIITASHRIGPHEHRSGTAFAGPVTICEGAWIGAGVTILPGVTIGAGAVIAAGAVVTANCDPDTLYGGIPAKPIRPLTPSADA